MHKCAYIVICSAVEKNGVILLRSQKLASYLLRKIQCSLYTTRQDLDLQIGDAQILYIYNFQTY